MVVPIKALLSLRWMKSPLHNKMSPTMKMTFAPPGDEYTPLEVRHAPPLPPPHQQKVNHAPPSPPPPPPPPPPEMEYVPPPPPLPPPSRQPKVDHAPPLPPPPPPLEMEPSLPPVRRSCYGWWGEDTDVITLPEMPVKVKGAR